MANYRPTNGVSFGVVHTVTAAEETAGELLINFTNEGNIDYNLAAVIQVQDASNVNVDLADAVITYPANGQVQIENGAVTFTLTAGYIVNIVAQRRAS